MRLTYITAHMFPLTLMHTIKTILTQSSLFSHNQDHSHTIKTIHTQHAAWVSKTMLLFDDLISLLICEHMLHHDHLFLLYHNAFHLPACFGNSRYNAWHLCYNACFGHSISVFALL